MNHLLTALGVGSIALAATCSRRGSRVDRGELALIELQHATPVRLAQYLDEELRWRLEGHKIGEWVIAPEYHGEVSIYHPVLGVSLFATPGWDYDPDAIPIQIQDDPREDIFSSIPMVRRTLTGRVYLWTGIPNRDIEVYKDALRPLLARIEEHVGRTGSIEGFAGPPGVW